MTVDSIPISELGQRGAGLRQRTIETTQRLRLFRLQSLLDLHLCLLSLFYERSHSRHAPQGSLPTSKPGRPQLISISQKSLFIRGFAR